MYPRSSKYKRFSFLASAKLPIREDWFAKAVVTQKAGPFILHAILSLHTLSSMQGTSSMKEGDLPPRQLNRCFPGSFLFFSRHAHPLIKNKDSRVGTIIPIMWEKTALLTHQKSARPCVETVT